MVWQVQLCDPTEIRLRAHLVGAVTGTEEAGIPRKIEIEQATNFMCDEPFELLSRVHSTHRRDALLPNVSSLRLSGM